MTVLYIIFDIIF